MTENAQRILVLGAGGIGTLLAVRLAEAAGSEVLIASRTPPETVSLTVGAETATPSITVVASPDDVDPVDWVVVATKADDTAAVLPWLASPACVKATVAVAQNGIGHAERVAPAVPAERVVPLLVTYGVERSAPGEARQTLDGVLRIPTSPAGDALAALVATTSLAVERVDDDVTAGWTKLTWNLVGNALSTIAEVPVREIGRRPELRALAAGLVDEAVAVARAEGARLDDDLAEQMLTTFVRYPRAVRSSTLQDRAAGRPLELPTLLEPLLAAAERHGIAVPRITMASQLLTAISPKRRPTAVKVPALPRVWCAPTAALGSDADDDA